MRKQTKLVAVASAAALLALGASMTSFAAGWTQQDGEWVYLDKYGDRTYNEWKKSGSDYYYLNDDGVMATEYVVVEENGDKYYVDATGKKVVNTWVELDNEEDILVGDNEVDTLWMYFDAKGKAVKNTVKELSYAGGKAKFGFDTDGYMLSGWQTIKNKKGVDELYYFGDENEGWALTGWQQLEPEDGSVDPYEDYKWFYFDKGVAVQGKTKYIAGKYYTFNADGTLGKDWYNASTPASGAKAYSSIDGTTGLGWVKAKGISDSDKNFWFYLTNVREGDKVARGIPFNYGGEDYAAKVIKSRTYLFNTYGEMVTGLKTLTSDVVVGDAESGKVLPAGTYYFNKAADGVEGQMVTGRFTITEDAEEFFYHFAKNGKAYANEIKDGVLYGANGKRIQAEDGNTYALVTVEGVKVVDKNNKEINGLIAVNANGRVKTSGSIKIDDVYYDVDAATYNVTKRAAK